MSCCWLRLLLLRFCQRVVILGSRPGPPELGLLEAVHVPCRVMIVQGTDGLSPGVWVSSLHSGIDPTDTNADVFAPVEFSRTHIPWVLEEASLPTSTPIVCQPWDGSWAPSKFLHRVTLWFPPPVIA
jgi:hypothetical protein